MTVQHNERVMARVVEIDAIFPIKKADRIELAMVGGWQVIVQKGLYSVGDKAVYCEVDSLLPTDNPAFSDLTKLSSKLQYEIDGKNYARIKTMKMKGELSQGFCVPLDVAGVIPATSVGWDVTKELGIIKYESEGEKAAGSINAKTGTSALGFPKFIPKTDQNRVQNITKLYEYARDKGELFEKSFKLDGSSLTIYIKDSILGVCSRNVGMRLVAENKGIVTVVREWFNKAKEKRTPFVAVALQIPADDNAFTKMAQESGVMTRLVMDGRNLAVQGEMVGPSIQKNFEGVDKNEFYVYDIYLIDEQRYMLPKERQEWCSVNNVSHVPLASTHAVTLPVDVEAAIKDADGPSGLKGAYREGFVYKSMDRDFTFKVVSNRYLLDEE